jgi:hypothetical protein
LHDRFEDDTAKPFVKPHVEHLKTYGPECDPLFMLGMTT